MIHCLLVPAFSSEAYVGVMTVPAQSGLTSVLALAVEYHICYGLEVFIEKPLTSLRHPASKFVPLCFLH